MGNPKNVWTPPTLGLSVHRYAVFKAWRTWWEDYAIITELDKKPNQYQWAMLRYTFTEETQEIYQSLNITSNDTNTIMEELKKFARSIVSKTLECHTHSTKESRKRERHLMILLQTLKYLARIAIFVPRAMIPWLETALLLE